MARDQLAAEQGGHRDPEEADRIRPGDVAAADPRGEELGEVGVDEDELAAQADPAEEPEQQEDGSICRYYVANGTGGVIFKDTNQAEDAWEFLKWWTDHSTQVTYTYTLRSTYGKQFFWMPSNLEALADAPIDQADKDIILEQVQWLRDVTRTPGQYLVERSISDIWNTMVLDGTSAQVAVDEKTIDINREIKKKMTELGYYNESGDLVEPFVIRDIDWIKEQMERDGKEATE